MYVFSLCLLVIALVIRIESKKWREAYINKEINNGKSTKKITSNSDGLAKSESSLEQQTGQTVETNAKPKDLSHLVSKSARTVVSFGEEVTD